MPHAAFSWRLGVGSLPAVLLSVVLLSAVLALPPVSGERERTVAHAACLYHEDAPARRPVAAVTAELRRGERGSVVEVRVAALGPGVVPVPGIEGVPGANLRTADELASLLDRGGLRIVTRRSGLCVVGERVIVEPGELPRRRFSADGGLEAAPPVRRDAVAATFRSAPLPAGPSRSYLEASGVPRLLVEVRLVDGLPTLHLEPLGDPAAAPFGGRR